MALERAPGAKRLLVQGIGSLVLSLVLVGAVSQPLAGGRNAQRKFVGSGSLPLSGDLGALGGAFREGFLSAMDSSADSLQRWEWRWHDHAGDPMEASRWLERQRSDSGNLLVVGISSATVDLPPCPLECLVVGDGGAHAHDSLRWELWAGAHRQAVRLLARLRSAPGPRAVIYESTGAWAEVVHHLADSLPDLILLPHDLDNTKWDEPLRQFLVAKPRTVLFWDGPVDASSFLQRRLAWPLLSKAKVWVPEGAVVPPGISAEPLAPLWQAQTPSDSLQAVRWRDWGRAVGRRIGAATRWKVRDSLTGFGKAFRKLPADSTVEIDSAAWFPRGL